MRRYHAFPTGRSSARQAGIVLATLAALVCGAGARAESYDLLTPDLYAVGNRWQYETHVTLSGGDEVDWRGTEQTRVLRTETVENVSTLVVEHEDFDEGWKREYVYFTDDYLKSLRRETDVDIRFSNGDDREILPLWTESADDNFYFGHATYWAYEKTNPSYTWTGFADSWLTFLGREAIVVPAGTFRCTKVEVFTEWQDADGFWGQDTHVLWIDPAVGIIRGDYYQWDWDPVDGAWAVAWSNEISWTNIDAPRADLVVDRIWAYPPSPVAGEVVLVGFDASNWGDAASVSSAYSIRIDGAERASGSLPALAGSGGQWAGENISVGRLAEGMHIVEVVVDPDGLVWEENENNNSRSGQLTAGPRPAPSADATRALIADFYATVLNRAPEPGAVNNWQTGHFDYVLAFDINVQHIPREMGRLFFLSTEYANRRRSDAEFITDCYRTFLQRDPSALEIAQWTSGEWNRAEAMTIIAESEEFADRIAGLYRGYSGDPTRNFVDIMYIGLLDRLVDAGGLDHWTRVFNDSADKKATAQLMGRAVMDSAEFLASQPANEKRVERLYRAYLGRFPNNAELDYWTDQLNSGAQTISRLIQAFSDSPEFTARLDEFFQ